MPGPFQSQGGGKSVLREEVVVIQDRDGIDVIRLGRDADDLWAIVMVDPTGIERVRIGQLAGTDEYGIEVKNRRDQEVFTVDNDGQSLPYLTAPMGTRGGIAGLGIQNSTYAGDGDMSCEFVPVAAKIRMVWGLSYLSGTYDVRLTCSINGATATVLAERKTIQAAASQTVDVDLPGGAVGSSVVLTLEARRTAGAELGGLQVIRHPVNYA
jgi:hypothetical protein